MFAFDIETDTAAGGLDPAVAAVTSIAVWSPTVQVVIDDTVGGERARLKAFVELISSIEPTIAATWNGSVFDLPYLVERAAAHDLRFPVALLHDPAIVPKYEPLPGHRGGYRARVGPHAHLDVAYLYRHIPDVDWGLKPICAHFGIEMVTVDREQLHVLPAETVADYNLSDARGTYLLAERLGSRVWEHVDEVPS